MPSMLKKRDWSATTRRGLTTTEIVTQLSKLEGWGLQGEGTTLCIAKTYRFANFYQTVAFVNAVAFVAHVQDHHPELAVSFNRCVVQFNTHDVGGLSGTDFECATAIDASLQ